MSHHYEFLTDDFEIIADADELRERFEDPDVDQVHLVLGNPWDAAGVLTGTPGSLADYLEQIARALRGDGTAKDG